MQFPTQIGLKKIIKSVKSSREIPTLKISLESKQENRQSRRQTKNMSSLQINPGASPLNVPVPSKTCQNGSRSKSSGQKMFAFGNDYDSRPLTSKNQSKPKPSQFMVYKSTRQLTVPREISLHTQMRSDMEALKIERIKQRNDSVEKYENGEFNNDENRASE